MALAASRAALMVSGRVVANFSTLAKDSGFLLWAKNILRLAAKVASLGEGWGLEPLWRNFMGESWWAPALIQW